MTDCGRTAERLAAYADESLPASDRADVERHLDGCPPCRTAAAHQREAHRLIRGRADALRAQPLPPGLRSRCETLVNEHTRGVAPAWRARIVPVTLTAILLVFTGTAILSLATQRSDALLAAQLSADHTRCFRQFVPSDASDLDAPEVEATLASLYGWDIHIPPSADAEGIHLVHARRCPYADERIPHILYRVNGQDLSLYMIDGVVRDAANITAFGHRSRVWTRGTQTFVLVSSADGADLAGAVRYVMEQAR